MYTPDTLPGRLPSGVPRKRARKTAVSSRYHSLSCPINSRHYLSQQLEDEYAAPRWPPRGYVRPQEPFDALCETDLGILQLKEVALGGLTICLQATMVYIQWGNGYLCKPDSIPITYAGTNKPLFTDLYYVYNVSGVHFDSVGNSKISLLYTVNASALDMASMA